MKFALAWAHEKLDSTRCKLLGTIHDEILALAQDDYVEEACKILKDVMEQSAYHVFGTEIKFVADVAAGQTWASCKKKKVK